MASSEVMSEQAMLVLPAQQSLQYWTILAPRLGNENSRQFSFLSLYVANKSGIDPGTSPSIVELASLVLRGAEPRGIKPLYFVFARTP